MINERKALILSVGYGRGHHSAARALAEEMQRRSWQTRVIDPCALAHPHIFRFTQGFYNFCVRHSPALWGVVYRRLDTADWSRMIHRPIIRACIDAIRREVAQMAPDLVVCTYPLFAYMLDHLTARGELSIPYAVVVTDALAISSPWVLSQAPLICLPDALSAEQVAQQHSLPPERLAAPGFPVRAEFAPGSRPTPGPDGRDLHVVYGAHARTARVKADISAMLKEWPQMRLSIVADPKRHAALAGLLRLAPGVSICPPGQDMAELLRTAHLYVGKAGAATVFEAYSAEVPVLVNYSLPGQEQGNLQLLLHDAAGLQAESTEALLQGLHRLLDNSAAGWLATCAAMRTARRAGGAARTIETLERRFFA